MLQESKFSARNFINKNNAIIIADDFAMSQGTDSAILEMLKEKKITATSVLVTSNRFGSVNLPQNSAGLHLDFTFGKAISISGKSLITDSKGYFNKSFIQIMLLCFVRKNEMQALVENEIEAQILKLQSQYGNITHIDGHQHIHMNPLIFQFVKHFAEKYKIPRIRFVNEKIFQLNAVFPSNFLNFSKLLLLRTLSLFCNYKSDTYFISILHTCKISKQVLLNYKVPKKFQKIEVMLHPSNVFLDYNAHNKERKHLLSHFRTIEKKSLEN